MTETTNGYMKIQSEIPPEQVKIDLRHSVSDAPPQKKRRARSDTQRKVFGIAIILAFCVVIPYAYYSVKISSWVAENAPPNFNQ